MTPLPCLRREILPRSIFSRKHKKRWMSDSMGRDLTTVGRLFLWFEADAKLDFSTFKSHVASFQASLSNVPEIRRPTLGLFLD